MEKLLKDLIKLKRKNLDKPLVLKISPDINETEISPIIELVKKYKIQGIIISNTTDSTEKVWLTLKKMRQEDYRDNR